MFCCTFLYVHSSIAIILMGKRELVALLNLSSWCLMMVKRLFLAVPRGCLRFAIVVFTDHTHYFCLSHDMNICNVHRFNENKYFKVHLYLCPGPCISNDPWQVID